MNVQEKNSVIVQLGKKGISDHFVDNIKKELARNKLVKIKFLKNVTDTNSKKELEQEVLNVISNLEFEHKLIGNTLFIKRIKKH